MFQSEFHVKQMIYTPHKNYRTTLKYRYFSKTNMHESNILGLHHVETVFIYLFASTNTDKDFFGNFSFNL
jgi:hypothetical protein